MFFLKVRRHGERQKIKRKQNFQSQYIKLNPCCHSHILTSFTWARLNDYCYWKAHFCHRNTPKPLFCLMIWCLLACMSVNVPLVKHISFPFNIAINLCKPHKIFNVVRRIRWKGKLFIGWGLADDWQARTSLAHSWNISSVTHS